VCTSGSLPLCGRIVPGEECRHRTGMSYLVCRLVIASTQYCPMSDRIPSQLACSGS